MMTKLSYSGYRFPPEIIQQAIWLYVRFTLSFRDVEDLLAERGIMASYETVRRWVNHFGPVIAADLRKRRPKPHTTWHLDEVYLKIDGRMVYLWRAVDAEGEVLDVLVQAKRNKRAALKLMRKLLKQYGFVPDKLVMDDLRSYGAAARDLGLSKRHERGRWRQQCFTPAACDVSTTISATLLAISGLLDMRMQDATILCAQTFHRYSRRQSSDQRCQIPRSLAASS
jgi:putative transposase